MTNQKLEVFKLTDEFDIKLLVNLRDNKIKKK